MTGVQTCALPISERSVQIFNYDNEQGQIINKISQIDLVDIPGVPDGMTVDESGNLWVA